MSITIPEIEDYQEEIALLTDQLESIMGGVRSNLEAARDNHKKLAGSYEQLINTGKLQAVSQELITRILGDVDQAVHYFARAITSDGLVDFFEEITGECSRRYILQGPPGNGKSWFMRRIGEEALAQGHRVGFYHSGLDPDLLEMVVLHSLETAIVDGDAVRLANRPGDCYINLAECWDDTQAADHPAMREMEWLVSIRVFQAVLALTRARQVEQKLSRLFASVRFEQVDARQDERQWKSCRWSKVAPTLWKQHEDHVCRPARNMVTRRYIRPLLWGGQQCFLGIGETCQGRV